MNRCAMAMPLLVILACAQPETDTATPDVTRTATATAAFGGNLTKPISQYTGQEFYELVNGMDPWGGSDTWVGAPAGSGTTTLTITAAADANNFLPSLASEYGTVIARITNGPPVQGQRDNRYGTTPGPANRYYMIVSHADSSRARWILVRLTVPPGGGQPVLQQNPVSEGWFGPCNNEPKHSSSTARFNDPRGCPHPFTADTAAGVPPPDGLVTEHDWITCESGCCMLTL